MRRTVPVFFLSLALLAGCGPAPQPPAPTAVPQATPPATPLPTPSPDPVALDDNPYASDSGEVYTSWYYDIWEAYRGAEGDKPSEQRGFTYLDYEIERTESREGSHFWYANHIHLPQCPGEDTFAVNFSRHYREVYDGLLEEERAYFADQGAWEDYERRGRGLSMGEEFQWNGFYQVVLDDCWSGGRVLYEPVVEVFYADTGEKVELESLFSGQAEDWLPELGRRLQENGFLPPMGTFDSQTLLQDATFFDIGFAVDQGIEGFRNFLLTPGGLGFAFRTGLVSSMSQGPMVVVVPYEAVSDLMAQEFRDILCP